ncbi:hypothetical protein HOF92_00390 [bacterium]|jgi:hypothetical protein|nr:hypothetical protein [bacterium]
MSLAKLECVQYGNYYVNPDHVTFISCGEQVTTENGSSGTEIFIHFGGGKESAMIMVSSVEDAINALNQ